MKADRYTLADFAKRKQFGAVAESMFGFGLIRHTKHNPNRQYTFMRTSIVWIGSYDNYRGRIKRRWPIRFFLSYTLPDVLSSCTIERIRWNLHRAKRLRLLESEQIALEEAIRAVIGVIPKSRRDVFRRLTESLPNHPDLVRRVDVSYGLSQNQVLKLKLEAHKITDSIKPRAGQGTKLLNDYPEVKRFDEIAAELAAIRRQIGSDAAELAILISQSVKTVES